MRPQWMRRAPVIGGVVATLVFALLFVAVSRNRTAAELRAVHDNSGGRVGIPQQSAGGSGGANATAWPSSRAAKLLPDPADERMEPLAEMPTGRAPRVLVVTLATGNYRQFGVDLLESAAKYFCSECNLTLLLMTDRVDGLPSLGGRLVTHQVPWRPWPRSTISKCTDVNQRDALIREQDFAMFLDADLLFMSEVHLADMYGDYVAVEHPYYPRNDRGWCGKWGGDAASTQRNGFDKNGVFTFCQYPYDRDARSTAYIPLEYGKIGPGWNSGNLYYLQGALFGGTGDRFSQLCATMTANVATDDSKGITAMFHDESHLNALMLFRYDRTRILDFSYMYPPLESAAAFTWIKVDRPRIMHRSKDLDVMRRPPTDPPGAAVVPTDAPRATR